LFYVTEPVDACCAYGPTAPDNWPVPYLIMCNSLGGNLALTPKPVIMNANPSCRCDLPLATQPTTWGGVKALYR
jgi:hypothetical protein